MDEKKGELHLNKAAKTGNQDAVKMLAEYKEWKKKNKQAMQQYQELLKKVQLNQIKPQLSSVTPQPAPGFPAQPVPEAPFSVIPGQSYLGMNQIFTPAITAPQSTPIVNIVPKVVSAVPQPEKVLTPVESGKDKGGIQTQSKPVGQEQSLRPSEK